MASGSAACAVRPPRHDTLLGDLRALLPDLQEQASDCDHLPATHPHASIAALARCGALSAPLPAAYGGLGWGVEPGTSLPLMKGLRLIGQASLPLGRLFEGHVNALRLAFHHGDAAQQAAAAHAALRGELFGVWNAESRDHPLWLQPDLSGGGTLHGGKILCSGAGLVRRALVTARRSDDGPCLMLIVPVENAQQRADLSPWQPSGMRASATGSFDFEGMPVGAETIHGAPEAYFTQPDFSAGAWRFLAVQLGGTDALVEALRTHLRTTGRGQDPYQAARFGQAVTALETARLWVQQAATLADEEADAAQLLPYVGLARGAVERAALDVLELVQRSIGLQAFLQPAPVERIARDLATYLRQPGPDRVLAEAAAACLAMESPIDALWESAAAP